MAGTKKRPRVPPATRPSQGRRRTPKPQREQTGTSLLTRRRIVIVAAAATALAVALVGASLLSARGDGDGGAPSAPAGTEAFGAPQVEELLAGIPQDGNALGDPDAPVTLVEYADIQCPFCAEWAAGTLPELISDYVRSGDLRIEFRGMAFIGADSETGLRAALAAGEQDRLWHVVDLLYVNQGAENSGWVSDELLAAIGRSVPGLDGDAMLAASGSDSVSEAFAGAAAQAEAAGVEGTPAFELGPTGGELETLAVTSLDAAEFRAAIDRLLGR